MALEGQRPGVIPAWGIAPGNGFKTIFSANGAAYHSGGVVWRRHDGSGRWPLVAFADGFLGDAPGWDGMGPLARKNPLHQKSIIPNSKFLIRASRPA
jgi:hypothetical protein